MHRIIHLSDLHIVSRIDEKTRAKRDAALDALHRTLVRLDLLKGSLLALTGDLIDSSDADLALVEDLALRVEAMLDAGAARAIMIPGNHDVRLAGTFGSHQPRLFGALARRFAGDSRVTVFGDQTDCLAKHLPSEAHGLPTEVILVNSTYLPKGYIGAGGLLRQEDLLFAASTLPHGDGPLLVMVHHHLVPTALTDTSEVVVGDRPWWQRYLVGTVLPKIVANADREELTMTALGAGSALTSLQSLGKPVIVLHGHKHVPLVRLLRGVSADQGDVILLAGGSAGIFEAFKLSAESSGAEGSGGPALWPSFNVVTLDDHRLTVETVAFRARPDRDVMDISRRPMLTAVRSGLRWDAEFSLAHVGTDSRVRVLQNTATYTLLNTDLRLEHWSADVTREVCGLQGLDGLYRERVDGEPDARIVHLEPAHGGPASRKLPTVIELASDSPTKYRLENFVFGNLSAARAHNRLTSPYEWIGLMNRFTSSEAVLVVEGLPPESEVFGSVTDLTTGIERIGRIDSDARRVVLRTPSCGPLSLLRIWWRLRDL